MASQEHINAAKAATGMVAHYLDKGPSNFNNPQAGAEQAVDSVQAEIKKFMHLGPQTKISKHSELAIGHKAGNCGGMASMAFQCLQVGFPNARSISYMVVPARHGGDSHACIAINAPDGTGAKNWTDLWMANVDDIVICDPWLAHVLIDDKMGQEISQLSSDEIMGAFGVHQHCDLIDTKFRYTYDKSFEYCREN